MGSSIVVSSNSFETDVLQKSYETPVVVDFFATWCGPCQMLKPVLENLVKEYDFVLAKIDIDQNPDLAHTYGVEGVPDVRIVTKGEVLPGFVGMLPEDKIRDLLTQLNLESALETGFNAIQVARTAGDVDEVKRLFGSLIERFPENRKLALEAALFLIHQNRLESAEKLLSSIQEYEKEYFSKAQAMRGLLQLKRDCENSVAESELDEIYLKGAQLAVDGQYEGALQAFLELVGRDRSYRKDGARKAMLTIFDLLGDSHPLSKEYRKQLMLVLF
ncbi:MAG TPA: tetratricopeptide repeat protein [Crinalium sp.]|jgi:putative thioredoxin